MKFLIKKSNNFCLKEQLKINFDNLNKQINDIENQKKELEKNKANLEKEKSKSKETHQDNEGRLVDYINQKIVELQLPGVYGTVESLSKINSLLCIKGLYP